MDTCSPIIIQIHKCIGEPSSKKLAYVVDGHCHRDTTLSMEKKDCGMLSPKQDIGITPLPPKIHGNTRRRNKKTVRARDTP